MDVWHDGGDARIRFEAADLAEVYLGHIIENQVIQTALLEKLAEFPRVEIQYQKQLESFTSTAKSVALKLNTGEAFETALLVGADGANSKVRELADIEMERAAYGQRAIVAMIKTEKDHDRTAWQRFLPAGPLALLPLANGCCSIVWSLDESQVQGILNLPEQAFNAQLTKAFAHHLGKLELVGERQAFPLQRAHAKIYVKSGVALIGDAAHTIHPLAGQGVNLGLLDAAALADVLIQAQRSPGSLGVLRAYERWRRGENQLMMNTMDGFHFLFGNKHTGWQQLRDFGLGMANAIAPLKNGLARRAMGRGNDLPSLARG